MCICINCSLIQNCKTYKFIEEMHGLKSLSSSISSSSFNPKQTIIKNEILSLSKDFKIKDWDIKECTNYIEKGGIWFYK